MTSTLVEDILADLAHGRSVSVIGLSNTGKSALMRDLSLPEAQARYEKLRGGPGTLIYVDGNLAVATSPQAFYEIVLRAALERLEDHDKLRVRYQAVTEAENEFTASLSFNLALTELCESLGTDLCLLIDEFDDLYTALDDRALLNLRALRDRFRGRLRFVTATVRRLPELRGHDVEGEFAEMFSRSIYPVQLLDASSSEELLEELRIRGLSEAQIATAIELAGGHPGLLMAVAYALAEGEPEGTVGLAPRPTAECLKIWNQLTESEREGLATLAVEAGVSLPARRLRRLEELGLVREGEIFSPLFAEYVARRARGPEIRPAGIDLDTDSGDVWVDGVRIPVLTDLEFRLLQLLHERRDKITDKYRIVEGVWGEDYIEEVDDARVEKLISRLRSKIEPDPAQPIHLTTVRGRGYRLVSVPR